MTAVEALAVPFVDARPEQLRHSTGLDALPALAAKVLEDKGWTIELRLLGSSHQVLLSRDGAVVFSETVACNTDGDLLPVSAVEGGYTINSEVSRFVHDVFEERVNDLMETLKPGVELLAGAFPGSDSAITAIALDRVEESSVAWRTWHAYPQVASIVATSSEYESVA